MRFRVQVPVRHRVYTARWGESRPQFGSHQAGTDTRSSGYAEGVGSVSTFGMEVGMGARLIPGCRVVLDAWVTLLVGTGVTCPRLGRRTVQDASSYSLGGSQHVMSLTACSPANHATAAVKLRVT